MTRRKQIAITAALAAVVISAAAVFFARPSSQEPAQPSRTPLQADGDQDPGGPSSTSADRGKGPDTSALPKLPGSDDQPGRLTGDADERRQANERRTRIERIRVALEDADPDSGNLQVFFDRLAEICGGREDCDALFEQALEDVDPERAAMLRRIRERLPEYKNQMKQVRMSVEDTSPRERFERIQNLRRETLGEAEAEAMYGQQRAFAEYRFGLGELGEDAGSMSTQQRRQALQELRADTFGDYQDELKGEEGALGRYRNERRLLLEGVTDEQTRERITREVRERHLDDETIEQMEKRDARREQQQAEVSDYKQAEQELKAEMEARRDQMPADQWQAEYRQRMTELRREHFDQ